ncbi:TetR/AcrR family transcriptional regulator [Glaciibacter superstes]|uniref:TetR/AcrR family transcriptional regulator n=1 Tax=Glaciibacter superstes TaxID=501023 RepID=UPI0003B74516|nr:TetR/AcrR family transcriptional regulator [Glaciibacter superstes]
MTSVDRGSRRGPYAKSVERRRTIVAAAHGVFAARGFRGGTFQEIADRVGMSQTSLLHYFPTKDDLLVAVLNHRDVIADGGPSQERPPEFADTLVHQAEYNETVPGVIELYTVLCGESATDDHPARDYFVARFDRLREEYAGELRALGAAGRLRDGVDPDRAAASIIALWDGIQTQWLLARGTTDMAGCLRDYLDLVILPASAPT